MTMQARRALVVGILSAFVAVQALAQDDPASGEVFTRAVVRGFSTQDARHYIHLKLVPRGKIPFSTLTYRVLDRNLVAGLREGQDVAFRAERRDGENVLTAIRVAAPCQRFQKCE